MDPFTAVTAFSGGVQPQARLALPPWVWQSALAQMTAFFRLGPVLTPDDVQKYWNPLQTLGSGYAFAPPPAPDPTVPGSAVAIPSLPVAEWAWLQPFADPAGEDGTSFMALGLAKTDGQPRYQKGPYTALEGYLQLKTPLLQNLPDSKPS
jgi:hypothetical protein